MPGGGVLLQKYGFTLSALLAAVYPEYEWLPWRFMHTPKNFWNDVNNQKKFVDWAGKQLQIKELSDWYSKSNKVKILFQVEIVIL